MTQNYAKPLRLLRSDSEVVRAHAAFAGADIIESLQAKCAVYKANGIVNFNCVEELEAEVERLETGIRNHIDWADTAVDCDDLKILVGDMQEDE